jgi:hypothetical protein
MARLGHGRVDPVDTAAVEDLPMDLGEVDRVCSMQLGH